MKLERLFAIVFILIENKTIRAKDLADRFEVSIRTIYRDIETLSAAGIPVYANRGRNGGVCIMEEYVLNKSLLSKEEQAQILASLKSMQAIEDGASNTMDKLTHFFANGQESWIDIDFASWQGTQNFKQPLLLLKKAILEKIVVTFIYSSLKEEVCAREVEPHLILYKGQDWYLYGYCLKRKAFRYFKLTRIQHLQLSHQHFIRKEMNREAEIHYPIEQSSVLCKVDKEKGYRILDEFSHAIVEAHDSYYLLRLQMNKDWLYSYLLTYQDAIEILEPKQIREEMIHIINKIKNKYK